jgi:hypothetical protein
MPSEIANRHETGSTKVPDEMTDLAQTDGLGSPWHAVETTGDGAEVGIRCHGHPVLGRHSRDRGNLLIDVRGVAAEHPR